MDGRNATLEAMVAPVNEASAVLERLAQRDLRARMTGGYQGDHARMKDALNATAHALNEAMVGDAPASGAVAAHDAPATALDQTALTRSGKGSPRPRGAAAPASA